MNDPLKILDLGLPNPRGPASMRRPHSVRRTATIDVTWPDGVGKPMAFHGYGRDIYTASAESAPTILTVDELFATITDERIIQAIRAVPDRANIDQLVGVRGGGKLRHALNDALPEERQAASPLYLLIDDLAGASLVSSWALYSSGSVDMPVLTEEDIQARIIQQAGVCIGFRPGSSALDPSEKIGGRQNSAIVEPLHNPNDPEGWHPLEYGTELHFRRARSIDVWRDGDVHIEVTFQDSAARPDGSREAVHEYVLSVSADPQSLEIKTIVATPHILPFPECPNAIESVSKMVGQPLAEMRNAVLETYPRVKGCTHLNDCMRSIAEVPTLIAQLDARVK